MKIESIHDKSFREYGEIVEGYDLTDLLNKLSETTECPADRVIYVPSDAGLEALPVFEELQNGLFGGLPIQIGYCNGSNTKLNCLEYHRGSELNVPVEDMVLLLAKRDELDKDLKIHTDKVKAFSVPAGTAVLLYETSMHYAPARKEGGFRVIIGLPRGTNTEKPEIKIRNLEDKLLWANNKWLIAHKDTQEAKDGAYVGLEGKNIDIA
ncbi:MAG: DUF4867 family protein [Clostridia bacterium]|nr:DUF4867 family protein [Clostridia bacterium]